MNCAIHQIPATLRKPLFPPAQYFFPRGIYPDATTNDNERQKR